MNERRQQGDDLTGRRGGYRVLKGELHSFFRRIWVVVILIGVTSTLGLVGYGFALREIQQQRTEVCENQNLRNANSRQSLIQAAAEDIENAPTAAMKVEIARRRDVTLGLINAIAPLQDCDQVVQKGFDAYMPW